MSTRKMNADDQAVVVKACQDLMFATESLRTWVEQGALPEEMATSLPSLMESHFTDIARRLDYASELTRQHAERFQRIQEANREIESLRQQLGSNRPMDGLKDQIRLVSETVSQWCQSQGLGHTMGVEWTHWSIPEFKITPSLNTAIRLADFLDHPVTDREARLVQLDDLRAKGFELLPRSASGEDWSFADTHPNRALFLAVLSSRFPSMQVTHWESLPYRKPGSGILAGDPEADQYILSRIEVIVRDPRDFAVPESQDGTGGQV